MSKYQTDDVHHIARMFSALSNPHRLEIFLRLASCCRPGIACDMEGNGSACVGELAEGLGIAPSTVSHHLKELREADLVRTERNGRRVECRIEPTILRTLTEFFADRLEEGQVHATGHRKGE